MVYVVRFKDAQNVESCSEHKWYLPHRPVAIQNKPGKFLKALNGAANFRGTSLNKSLPTGPDLLQNLIYVLRLRQHPFAVFINIEGMFLEVGVTPCDLTFLRFAGGPTSDVVVHQCTRHIFMAKDLLRYAKCALQCMTHQNARL